MQESSYDGQQSAAHFLVEVKTSRTNFTWRGLRLRFWAFLLFLVPLAGLTGIVYWACQASPIHYDAALLLTKEVSMWAKEYVSCDLKKPQDAITLISQTYFDSGICNRSQLTEVESIVFQCLAKLEDQVLWLEDQAGDATEYRFADGAFHISHTSSTGRPQGCMFRQPNAALSQFEAIIPASARPIPSLFPSSPESPSPFLPLVSPSCQAGPTGLTCRAITQEGISATLLLPTQQLMQRMKELLSFSVAHVTIFDRSQGITLISPCGAGISLTLLASCISSTQSTIDLIHEGETFTDKDVIAVRYVNGFADWGVLVQVPLAEFRVEGLKLPPLITAAAVFFVFGAATYFFIEHLARIFKHVTQALNTLEQATHANTDLLALHGAIREAHDILQAYNATLRLFLGLKAYAPTGLSSSPILAPGIAQSESSCSSACTGYVRARQLPHVVTSSTPRPSQADGDISQTHPFMSDLADRRPSRALTSTQLVSLDGGNTELAQRVGSVLVVELWYMNAPFSHMSGELPAQQSIGETFLHMVLACLEEYRGTVVKIDMCRVVAAWNIYSSQAAHEYWACKAALEIRNHFPTSINGLYNLFSKGELDKQELRVMMAVARGPLNSGSIRSSSRTATVFYGDALRMAERLASLNLLCSSSILMPQQTFEAVQGYVTAEMVDYVLDIRRERVITVYQLLGTNEMDSVGFSDLYKDALISFSHHQFEEARMKLGQCHLLLEEPDAKFAALRYSQVWRLQHLITWIEQMSPAQREAKVPNPYYRQYHPGWEDFDKLAGSHLSVLPLREPDDMPKSIASELCKIRAGMTTVTADVLQGMLNKKRWDSDENLGCVRDRLSWSKNGIAWRDTSAINIPHSIPTADSLVQLCDLGEPPDQKTAAGPVDHPSDHPSNGIDGRSFRDIFGRMWRCSRECLGQGGFGTVYLGIDEQGKISAIKEHVFQCNSETIREKVSVNEVLMLWNLQHKNIVSYQGCAVVQNSLAIIMEYISCGSLEFIVETFGCISEGVAVQYTRDTIRGLAFLHSHSVVHLDVKPANVLLDQHGTCKLADFGTATALSNLMDLDAGLMGTPVYMAPERVTGTTSDLSDIWSWGITLAEVITGRKAYDPDLPPEAILFGLYAGTLHPAVPDTLSLHTKSFLYRCLARNPAERAHAEELLGHPFLL